MRRFELVLPGSLDDCVKALARHGSEAKLLAGGTDLLPQMKNALLKPAVVIDLSGVSRLRAIESGNGQGLKVGAAVTARTLELDRSVRSRFLSLAESGALVGSVQVRNLATLGGNLCNAAPSADMLRGDHGELVFHVACLRVCATGSIGDCLQRRKAPFGPRAGVEFAYTEQPRR